MKTKDKVQIRNSTIDFLTFTRDSGEDGIEVRVQDGDVWLTQKGIAQLFEIDRSVVTKHLKHIFSENELEESAACAKFAQTADDGKTYQYKFYDLKPIIAVGYRINSAALYSRIFPCQRKESGVISLQAHHSARRSLNQIFN